MIPWLETGTPFPAPETALTAEHGMPGLLAASADLTPERLLSAYQNGIFPWYSEGQPVLWWSTDPRMVLKLDDFKISASLKKTIKKCQADSRWAFRFDTAFEQVMRACAEPRRHQDGTWISEDIIRAYCGLHQRGLAHSSEIWFEDELVGGAYGVCLGKMFYGESMFARVSDASKIALTQLVFFLRKHDVKMIDCQQETAHLASFGAKPITRQVFLSHLHTAIQEPAISNWHTQILFSD